MLMKPCELVASSTQSASSVPGPNRHPSPPLVGELTANEASNPGAITCSAAVRVVPLKLALMVDEELLGTVEVLIVNEAPVWPPGTITEDGTCATVGLLLVSDTTTPLAGAAVVSVTMPEGCCCPVTADWDSESETSARPEGTGVGLG